VVDLESGQSLRTLEGHLNYVSGVAITPDGRRAVPASHDNTLRVWEFNDRSRMNFEKYSAKVVDENIIPEAP
jgi:WD40 repeat protein